MDPKLRLLPWTTLDGRPCYLSPDPSGKGHVTRLADEMEAMRMETAVEVLGHAKSVLDDPNSPLLEVRFAGKRLSECLRVAGAAARGGGRRLRGDDDAPLDPK
ncbi:hypothetical protein PV682_18615 [Streptomyces niveiscabiei]|uniref:hypothetical protein n=1 Tax=Streptomyces niveiscabiei TaxID=164115 RepID=UPI0029A0E39F|nr:hypothetical protein [Streptomyces niveiscabiei]MDX3383466.1 hypothetical protein [Streptomyces niveiscabiei]